MSLNFYSSWRKFVSKKCKIYVCREVTKSQTLIHPLPTCVNGNWCVYFHVNGCSTQCIVCLELKCQGLMFGSLDWICNPQFCTKWWEEDRFYCFPLVCKEQTGYAWQFLIKDGWKIKYYEWDPSGPREFCSILLEEVGNPENSHYILPNIFLARVLPFFTGYFTLLLHFTIILTISAISSLKLVVDL